MDGLKRRLNESVQLKLSFTLSLAILVVAIVAGVLSFLSAFDEAHELQDDLLRQVAQLMDRQRLSPAALTTDTLLKEADEESRVIVQRLGEVGPSTEGVDAGGVLPLPVTMADGLQTLEVDGETFRVLIKTTPGNQWAVQRGFNRLVKQYFDAAGIEMPYPQTVVHFGRDKSGYASPADIRVVDSLREIAGGAAPAPGQTPAS